MYSSPIHIYSMGTWFYYHLLKYFDNHLHVYLNFSLAGGMSPHFSVDDNKITGSQWGFFCVFAWGTLYPPYLCGSDVLRTF